MADPPFVPTDFAPPTALVSDHFRLEPEGGLENMHEGSTSSIDTAASLAYPTSPMAKLATTELGDTNQPVP